MQQNVTNWRLEGNDRETPWVQTSPVTIFVRILMRTLRYVLTVACFALSAGSLAIEPVAYSDLTDEQLQALVQRLETLDVDERRAVATEINRRTDTERSTVRIESERRYGYRVRQPNGSVVSIERREKIIRYVDPDQPYGVGFEERVGSDRETAPPVEQVNHQITTPP